MLITNRCNFNCTYCFADHGSYGINLDNMSIEIARKTIDYFFKKYDKIYALSFFGGEPLIAIDLIDYVCGYIAENYEDNIPKYSSINLQQFRDIFAEYGSDTRRPSSQLHSGFLSPTFSTVHQARQTDSCRSSLLQA